MTGAWYCRSSSLSLASIPLSLHPSSRTLAALAPASRLPPVHITRDPSSFIFAQPANDSFRCQAPPD
ncbi:hypothetical protein FA13DRAFT_1738457 [Coprinellus micaceus]|uniref:Uncharacterized protein n=1 Tax=Coprinellus micaceus TaxID=71717 RepID=A0A4Y7STU9_COPMI|nr:hypothetical protein FA13DRAFT_1738457 [Coprinellus micaceus]